MAGTETVGGQVVDPAAALRTSIEVFNWIGWIGVASGIVFFVLSTLLRHWEHSVMQAKSPKTHNAPAADRHP